MGRGRLRGGWGGGGGERESKRTQAKIVNGRLKNPSRECLTYPCRYLHLIHAIVQGVYLQIYTPSSTACLQVYAKPRIAASHKSPLGTGLPNCCRRTKHAGGHNHLSSFAISRSTCAQSSGSEGASLEMGLRIRARGPQGSAQRQVVTHEV